MVNQIETAAADPSPVVSVQHAAGIERQKGIDRALDLLDGLMRARMPMRPGELARLIGAPRSTIYEIVNRLLDAGLLDYIGEEGKVYFGRTMQLYGAAFAEINPLYRRAAAAMPALVAKAGATVQICGLRGRKYVVLDSRSDTALFRITSDIGVEVPIPWTASGRLLLGHMTPEEIRGFVPDEDYRLPDGRRIAAEDFIADVIDCTRRGWSETTGLADRFTCCLAAPILDLDRVCRMTLCLVAPADTPLADRGRLLVCLRTAAVEVSGQAAALGSGADASFHSHDVRS